MQLVSYSLQLFGLVVILDYHEAIDTFFFKSAAMQKLSSQWIFAHLT